MAAGTHELGAVPCQKVSGWLAHASGVSQQTQTNRATFALIAEDPSEGEEQGAERADALKVLRRFRCDCCTEVSEVEGPEVDDGQDEGQLAPQEDPAAKFDGPAEVVAVGWVLAEGERGGCGQGEKSEEEREGEDAEWIRVAVGEGDAVEAAWLVVRLGNEETPGSRGRSLR